MAIKTFQVEGTLELDEETNTVRVVGVLSSQQLPGNPQNLHLIEVTDTFVSMAWNDAPDALSWNVFRNGVLYDTTSTPALYTDSVVVPDTDYVYQVQAVNSAGTSVGLSNSLGVHTSAPTGPDPPQNLAIDELTARQVRISWDLDPEATEWDVLRNAVYLDTVQLASFLDTTVVPSTSYTYTVIARNLEGDSAPSEALDVTTPANAPPVWDNQPQTGAVGIGFSLDLNDLCSDFDQQPLVYSLLTALPSGLSLNGSQIGGTPSAPFSGTVGIRASDGTANTDVSMSFVIAAAADTTAPTAPVITANAVGSTVTVTLATPSTDASGILRYDVYRSGDAVVYTFRGSFTTEGQFIESGVPDGNRSYKIRSIDNSPNQNVSAYSNIILLVISTAPAAPDVPINYNVIRLSNTSTRSTWQAGPSGATPTSYEEQQSLTGTDAQNPSASGWTTVFTGLALTDDTTGLSANTTYFRRLRAFNGAIPSSGYATDSVSTSQTASRVVFAAATWDLGDVENNPSSITDSFRRLNSGVQIEGAARSQGSGFTCLSTTSGNGLCGPSGAFDVRCIASKTLNVSGFPTEIILPRAGAYFMESELFRGKNPDDGNTLGAATKHYDDVNGSNGVHSVTKCKPRSQYQWSNDAYWIPYDTRFWQGLSYYMPLSFESDLSVGENNGPQLFENNLFQDANTTSIDFWAQVPRRSSGWLDATAGTTNPFAMPLVASGINQAWWCVRIGINPNSHLQEQPSGQFLKIALAPIGPDLGKWTDFVLDQCYNPFTSPTTVSGWTFRANTGRLRIWKCSGPVDGAGNRAIDEATPILSIINQPFGYRPRDATSSPRWQNKHYAFFLRGAVDSNRTHPIWMGIDEIRMGYAENRANGGPTIYNNMLTKYQGGIASGFNDVVPRS